MKGLERLSEELRLERQKAGEALQDVTRMRIEVASLRQNNDEKDAMISDLNEQLAQEQNEVDGLQEHLTELENAYTTLREATQSRDDEYEVMYSERVQVQAQIEELSAAVHEKDLLLDSLRIKCSGLEGRANGKEELINKLKREIQEVRNNLTEAEQAKLNLHEEVRRHESWNEELKLELGKFEVMRDGYQQTRSSNDGLRSELDAALKSNATYLEQIRELSLKIKDKNGNETGYEALVRELRAENDRVNKELKDLEKNQTQMNAQVRAEMEASEAAKERAQAAARGREFLDRQLHELQDKHGEVLRYNATLEEELTEVKTTASELQNEVYSLREKLVQSQSAVEQASGMQAMVMEMDLLRTQLNDVRRQLLRRGVEDEAGVMAPQAIAIREEECRKVSWCTFPW